MHRFVCLSATALGLLACSRPDTPELAQFPSTRPQELYCYQTLADVTCYADPRPEDTSQLVGWIAPADRTDIPGLAALRKLKKSVVVE